MFKTAWNVVLVFGSVAAVATACTVSSGGGSDTNDQPTSRGGPTGATGGTGGDGTGGTGGDDTVTTTSTTGTTAGGQGGDSGETSTGGTGGSGGAEVECLDVDDPTGEPAPTENLDPDANTCCILCAAANCPDELGACYADEPENVCGTEDGEMQALQDCMLDLEAIPGFEDDSDFLNCAAEAVVEASGPLCGLDTISSTTNELASCIHGDENGLGGCFEECFNPDFDDTTCTYRD